MTVWQVNSRGLFSNVSMKSRCPPTHTPSRSRVGSRPCTPSIQSQREAGLHGWGQGFSSHSPSTGHIQVTSSFFLSLLWKPTPRGPCPPRETSRVILVQPKMGGELFLRLKSHTDVCLRPQLWSWCRHRFTPQTRYSHCNDTTKVLRF